MKVVALGELLIDFACRETNADCYPIMDAHPGGAPANYLAALRKYGMDTALIGKVGNDIFGRLLVNTIKQAGISSEGIIVSDEVFTTLAFVTFNEGNDREFSFSRKPGADTCLSKDEISTVLIDSCDVFHFGTLSLTDEPSQSATIFAVDYAKEHGKLISYDPNLRKPLWKSMEKAKEQMLWGLSKADVVKISDEEFEFLFGSLTYEAAADRILSKYGVKLMYITLGKDGCYFANRNANGKVPALSSIHVMDTTGAGDIFGGSAMSALLQSRKKPEDLARPELEYIVRFACVAAGLSTTKLGGISSVPSFGDVAAILGSQV